METHSRQLSEREFYDRFYADGWEKQDHRIDQGIVPPNMRVYLDLVRDHILGLQQSRSEVRALDCGCGHGVLSVLVAQMGVSMTAVDISPRSIEILERFARANDVQDRIATAVAPIEDLPFADSSFDCLLGTRILHHVDVGRAAGELARVLRPGGKGFFWECTDSNAVIRFMRRHKHKLPFVPKFGTAHEHPLTQQELGLLGQTFGKPPLVIDAPFFFFTFMDKYLLFRKADSPTGIGGRVDAAIARRCPAMNRFSFHKVLVLERPAPEARA